MKIGLIVHSYTGNTLLVAEKLKDKLVKEGCNVAIERVEAVNEDPQKSTKLELKTIPDPSKYELIIFAAPVRAFSLSPLMKLYLKQITPFNNKRAFCFVTQHFPYPFLGGSNAIRKIISICKNKNLTIEKTSIINWSSKKREQQISELVDLFSTIK